MNPWQCPGAGRALLLRLKSDTPCPAIAPQRIQTTTPAAASMGWCSARCGYRARAFRLKCSYCHFPYDAMSYISCNGTLQCNFIPCRIVLRCAVPCCAVLCRVAAVEVAEANSIRSCLGCPQLQRAIRGPAHELELARRGVHIQRQHRAYSNTPSRNANRTSINCTDWRQSHHFETSACLERAAARE